jgi:hypothetical protein
MTCKNETNVISTHYEIQFYRGFRGWCLHGAGMVRTEEEGRQRFAKISDESPTEQKRLVKITAEVRTAVVLETQ